MPSPTTTGGKSSEVMPTALPGCPDTPPAHHVAQGEVFVTDHVADQVGMVLGSCVATVLWDEVVCVGGVNHLLLPPVQTVQDPTLGLQVNLMERLINGVLQAGGQRGQLRAKVFGGARMISGLSDAGARNGAFVTTFLSDEGIPCLAQSLGGHTGRRLRIWPARGRVLQRRLTASTDLGTLDSASSCASRANASRSDDVAPDSEALRLSGVELL